MMGSLTKFVDERIKRTIRNVSQQNKNCNNLLNFFYRNQMHYNYKLDENIFKMLI